MGKFQHDTPNSVPSSSEKLKGVCINPPPLARVNAYSTSFRTVLHLDICRRIQNDSKDVNQVHLWGFYNSSLKVNR